MAATNPGPDNLISWWSLNETSGSRADSHGSNTLTDNNTVGSATGKQSNAASFNPASSEYLSRADNASLSFGDDDFTITAWVYLGSTSSTYAIVDKWISSNQEYTISYVASGINRFRLLVSTSGSNVFEVRANSFGTPSSGTWYFITAWHDKTSNVIGINVNDGTSDTTAHTAGVRDGTADFRLGGRGSFYFNGRLDEVGLWDKVLSGDEIEWLYNSGTGRAYSELDTTLEFTTSITAATATSDTAVLSTAVSVSSSITAATATPDTVVFGTVLPFATAITAATATSDDSELLIIVSAITSITAATATSDDSEIIVARDFASAITAATDVSSAALGVHYPSTSSSTIASNTSGTAALVAAVSMSSSATIVTITASAPLIRYYLSSASITAATATNDTVAIVASMDFASAPIAATATSDTPEIAVSRTFSTSVTAATVTPDDITLFSIVPFTASITAESVSSIAELLRSMEYATAITAATVTPSTDLAISRPLTSAVTAATVTPDDVAFGLIVSYAASITAATTTNDSTTLDIYLNVLTAITAATSTSAPSITIAINMTSSATMATNTSTFLLLVGGRILVMAFSARRPGQTMTVRE